MARQVSNGQQRDRDTAFIGYGIRQRNFQLASLGEIFCITIRAVRGLFISLHMEGHLVFFMRDGRLEEELIPISGVGNLFIDLLVLG